MNSLSCDKTWKLKAQNSLKVPQFRVSVRHYFSYKLNLELSGGLEVRGCEIKFIILTPAQKIQGTLYSNNNNKKYVYLGTVQAQLKDLIGNYTSTTNAIWILKLGLCSALDKVNILSISLLLFNVPCFFWAGEI